MMTRNSLKRRAIKVGSENDWNCHRNMRNKVNYAVKCAKSKGKNTWKVLNDLMGKKSAVTEISELVTSSSQNGLSNAKDIADHFNKHFTQIGPDLATNLPTSTTNPEDYLKRHSTTFQLSEIKSSRVLKLLLKLDVSKATGLDQISNKILQLAGPVICNQRTDLFNLSVKSGIFPNDWKLAKVSPYP